MSDSPLSSSQCGPAWGLTLGRFSKSYLLNEQTNECFLPTTLYSRWDLQRRKRLIAALYSLHHLPRIQGGSEPLRFVFYVYVHFPGDMILYNLSGFQRGAYAQERIRIII